MREAKKKPEAAEEPKPVELTKAERPVAAEIVRVIEGSADVAEVKMSRAQIELLKRTVADGASDDELRMFLQVCASARLNPFLRQAHFVPFWDSKAGVERRVIVVGIDGFRAIAESGGNYAGNDDAVFAGDAEIDVEEWSGSKDKREKRTVKLKVPEKATVTVWKIVSGQRCAFGATARWREYYPGGKKGARWHSMPFAMLAKCAEALALRKAFPKLFSGMYAQEEMDQAMSAAPEDGAARGFAKLLQIVGKSDEGDLDTLSEKMAGSEKYSGEQKREFTEAADARRRALTGKKK